MEGARYENKRGTPGVPRSNNGTADRKQVETLDFKKYFLDIEKIERYPITFVVKTKENIEVLRKKLHADAISTYSIESVVSKYMDCIEELINIPRLTEMYGIIEKRGELSEILNEIILQSRVEFNFDEEDNDEYELL